MVKRDLVYGFIIGAAVGLLCQPMLSTLSVTLLSLGLKINVLTRIIIFLFFTVLAPLALFIFSLISKIVPVLYQFSKFAAIGTLNSFIDFGIVNLLIAMTNHAEGIWFASFKAVSFLFAATNSFIWNKLWTFDSKGGDTAKQAIKFYLITGVGLLINVSAASAIVAARPATTSANLWANFAVFCGIFASFLVNFLGYKFIVFKKTPAVTTP